MSDNRAEARAAWPPPPPFYREAIRAPPPPVDGTFLMYGVERSSEPPPPQELEQQLYDVGSGYPCNELRKLNVALLESYLQLLHVMVESPESIQLTGCPYPSALKPINVARAQCRLGVLSACAPHLHDCV